MDHITMFLMLVGAHSIGDYALQSNYIAVEKSNSLYVLFIHAMIWTTLISLMWMFLDQQLSWQIILFALLVPHFLMDYSKAQSKWYPKLIRDPKLQLAVDQTFHYTQLIVLLLVN